MRSIADAEQTPIPSRQRASASSAPSYSNATSLPVAASPSTQQQTPSSFFARLFSKWNPIATYARTAKDSPLRCDRDALGQCFSFLQLTERIACAVVCRQWNPVAMDSATACKFTFRYSSYADLARIPHPLRAGLERIEYFYDRAKPVCDPYVLRSILHEFINLTYIECHQIEFLRLLLDIQPSGKPIRGMAIKFGHPSPEQICGPDVIALLSHPRFAGLGILQ